MAVDQNTELELARMAFEECIKALNDARDALDRYYRICDRVFAGEHNEIGVEARKRLTQMLWFLEQIGIHQDVVNEFIRLQFDLGSQMHSGQITPEQWGERLSSSEMTEALRPLSNAVKAIENFTEAYYWIAFRARTTIRALPNMGGFEGKGIRDTRNKLLEHPEKGDSGVLITSFGLGNRQGPVIKAIRYDHQSDKWVDRGLFVNTSEFASELRGRLERCSDELQPR